MKHSPCIVRIDSEKEVALVLTLDQAKMLRAFIRAWFYGYNGSEELSRIIRKLNSKIARAEFRAKGISW